MAIPAGLQLFLLPIRILQILLGHLTMYPIITIFIILPIIGTNWSNIAYSYYTTGNSYNWTIPNTPSANCLVRVEDAKNTCKKDLSNANFTIIAATPFLLTPNGAEGWFAGTSRTISWASASYLAIRN